jgi:hypothetical protein
MANLPERGKEPGSARVLDTWIIQAQQKLAMDAGRLGWLVASTVVVAALQRAVDETGRSLFLLKGGTYLSAACPGAGVPPKTSTVWFAVTSTRSSTHLTRRSCCPGGRSPSPAASRRSSQPRQESSNPAGSMCACRHRAALPGRAEDSRLYRPARASTVIHRQDLADEQVGWWQQVPTFTLPTAMAHARSAVGHSRLSLVVRRLGVRKHSFDAGSFGRPEHLVWRVAGNR